jgi:uncharacterized membrane protein
MHRIEKSVDVDVPVRRAYNQWTQFEDFPKFMEGVKEVRQLDDQRVLWRAEIAGHSLEWVALITQQLPDERIGWKSVSGEKNAGHLSFVPLGPERSRITLSLAYDPEGLLQATGNALGLLDHRIEADLAKFKQFIEDRGLETGAWRGEIGHGHVIKPPPSGFDEIAAAPKDPLDQASKDSFPASDPPAHSVETSVGPTRSHKA